MARWKARNAADSGNNGIKTAKKLKEKNKNRQSKKEKMRRQ